MDRVRAAQFTPIRDLGFVDALGAARESELRMPFCQRMSGTMKRHDLLADLDFFKRLLWKRGALFAGDGPHGQRDIRRVRAQREDGIGRSASLDHLQLDSLLRELWRRRRGQSFSTIRRPEARSVDRRRFRRAPMRKMKASTRKQRRLERSKCEGGRERKLL